MGPRIFRENHGPDLPDPCSSDACERLLARLRRVLAALGLVVMACAVAFAQEPVAPPQDEGDDDDFPLPYEPPAHPTLGGYELTGSIELGWRFTALDGSRDAYRAIVDLPRGPSFGFSRVELRSPDNAGRFFDSLLVEGLGGGGEPASTGRVRAAKRGIYLADYRFSGIDTYNYQPDFANPGFENGVLLAPHGWDRTRRSDWVDVTFFPERRIEGSFAYRRSHQSGLGLGTDLSSESLVFNRRLDNSVHETRGAVALRFPKYFLFVEQGVRRYADDETDTADPFTVTDPETLARFLRTRTTQTTSPLARVLATARPWLPVRLTARVSYAGLDTIGTLVETKDAIGSDLSRIDATGTDDGHAFVIDTTQDVRVHDRVRFTNAFRYRRTRTVGTSTGLSTFGGDTANATTDIGDRSYRDARLENQTTVEYDLAEDAVVRAGYRFARRRYDYDRTDRFLLPPPSEQFSTSRTVLHSDEDRYDAFLAGGSYRLRRDARVFVEYENGREPNANFGFDDRALFFDRAGDYRLLRIRGAWTPCDWLEIGGSVRATDRTLRSGVIAGRDVIADDPDNPVFTRLFDGEPPVQDLRSRAASLTVRVSPWTRLAWGVTFDRVESRADVTYLTAREFVDPAGATVFGQERVSFRFRDDESLLTADLTATPIDRVTVSAYYSLVSTAGDVPVHYHQASARASVAIGRGVSGVLEWRLYDYDDHRYTVTDFRANHAIAGLKWEF